MENPLDPDNTGATMGVPIANIIDLQFEYIDKDNQYWCSLASVDSFGDPIVSVDRPCASGAGSGLCHDFYKKFKFGQIIGLSISIALRTELEVHRFCEELVKRKFGESFFVVHRGGHWSHRASRARR